MPANKRPLPNRSMFTGSDSIFIGKGAAPMNSAKAPELSKGNTTNKKDSVIKAVIFFTVHTPAYVKFGLLDSRLPKQLL